MNTNIPKWILRYDGLQELGKYGISCSVDHPRGRIALHRHDCVAIEFVTKGWVQHELNGDYFEHEAGDCWCVDHIDVHAQCPSESFETYCVHLRVRDLPEMVQYALMEIDFPSLGRFEGEELERLKELFWLLHEFSQSDEPFSREKTMGYLLLFLSEIFQKCHAIEKKSYKPGYQHIVSAIEYAEKHFKEPLTIESVAKVIHLSTNYFSRLFTEVCGCTFVDFLTYLRMQHAKQLLADTDLPITYIPYEAGFVSFSGFSRIFKKLEGCTPTYYRNLKKAAKRL